MSCTVRFNTRIKDVALLRRACDQMRNAKLAVEGPTVHGDRQCVRMPGWGSVLIDCTTGEATYDSDYAGDRKILNRLSQEYGVAAAAQELLQDGCYISSTEYDGVTGLLRARVEIPEMVANG